VTTQYPSNPFGQPTPVSPAPKPSGRWKWIAGIVAAFVLGLTFGSLGNSDTSSQAIADAPATSAAPAPTYSPPTYSPPTYEVPAAPVPTPTPEPTGPATSFSDGIYEVGVDVEPGRYKTPGSGGTSIWDSCYWERAKDDSGELRSIIANDNITGPGSITLKEGEFVKGSGGCVWTKQ
jgi:hypothetical protein